MEEQNNPIIIYQSEDGNTRIEVKLENETVWLTQQQLCDLYQTSRTNVVEHIQHIYEEGELDESSTCRKFRQVRQEGSRMVERELSYYNLDMIISLGYRIRSKVATHFRKWATERLKEYIIKGFAQLMERADVVVLDVRTEEEFKEGHLEGALNIDQGKDGFVDKVKATLSTDKTIAIYCRSGRRSANATEKLAAVG